MPTPNLAISFAAGLLSFLSPCVLPLIPSYISFVGGVTLGDLRQKSGPRFSVFFKTLLFVLGFSSIFIVLGIVFSGSGALFSSAPQIVNIIAGLVIVVLGLNIMLDFWKFLNIERKFQVKGKPKGYVGSLLVGMAFGAGWTPCIGPILAGILFMAGSSGTVGVGVLYLGVYSLGLGMPFLLASLFFDSFLKQMAKIKKHMKTIKVFSGLLLVAIGLLIAFGRFAQLSAWLLQTGAQLRNWDAANPGVSVVLFGSIALLLAAIPFIPPLVRRIRAGSGGQAPAHRAPGTETTASPSTPEANGGPASGPASGSSGSGATAVATAEQRAATEQKQRLPKRYRFLTPGRLIFGGALTVVAVLQFTGIISLANALFEWLMFQGI
mgnify:FL=1